MKEATADVLINAVENDTDIYGIEFENVSVPKLKIMGTDISDCIFSAGRFDGTVFSSVHFSSVVFRNSDVSNIRMENCSFDKVKFINCRMTGIAFTQSDLFDCEIRECFGQYANFSLTSLKKCILVSDNFSKAAFTESRFKNTEVRKCNFDNADFMKAELAGTDFSDCSINGAYLDINKLKGVTVSYDQAIAITKLFGINVRL